MGVCWSCLERISTLGDVTFTLYFYFVFKVRRMTGALVFLLLAGPVMLAAGGPVRFKATNGTIPLVLWHGMGE